MSNLSPIRSEGFTTTIPVTIDNTLSSLSRYTMLACIAAAVLLCCTVLFTYFSMQKIMLEQSRLQALQNSTSQLWVNIRDSSNYLSDLKTAQAAPDSESLLARKIHKQLLSSTDRIESLKKTTQLQLGEIQEYEYFGKIDSLFNAAPARIWINLDRYLDRLKELSADSQADSPQQLWLPVETTAAKNGVLGKGYRQALAEFQAIVTERSGYLKATHFRLTLFSIVIVVLELFFIFIPLQRHLARTSRKLREAHKELNHQANFDAQTGFLNAAGMTHSLGLPGCHLSADHLLLLSINNYVDVSRIIGPTDLGTFFQQFADRIEAAFPEKKSVFRVSDNQFGIILSEQDYLCVETNIADINSIMSSKLSVQNSMVYPQIVFSNANGSITSENLSDRTVQALIATGYSVPEGIGISGFEPAMKDKLEQQNSVIEQIQLGLNDQEFLPYYQLKVNASTQEITGMEALCRWIKSDGTVVFPGDFIPMAEKSGQIAEITWQLLDVIASDYNKWIDAGLRPGRIAFNASESVLLDRQFSERLRAVISRINTTECPLDIEITETVALSNHSDTISRNLLAARELGLLVALDDFGTGFASLSSLVELDFDVIKIDRSFVSSIAQSDDSKNIVASIVGLSRQLEKKCVVEGVETLTEYSFCRDLNCDEIQGYYFYRPEPYAMVCNSLNAGSVCRKAG